MLRKGCLQEEILCSIRPEIISGCLFIEKIEQNEAVVIEGAERFSHYKDYSHSFKWTGDFNEVENVGNTR